MSATGKSAPPPSSTRLIRARGQLSPVTKSVASERGLPLDRPLSKLQKRPTGRLRSGADSPDATRTAGDPCGADDRQDLQARLRALEAELRQKQEQRGRLRLELAELQRPYGETQ
jgi:transposase